MDSPMPDDGDEILVSHKNGKWVCVDVCCYDDSCYLESDWDWRDIAAWMPLPEPYKEAKDEQRRECIGENS